MADIPLIRRVVIADRGLRRRKHRHRVTISTEVVFECLNTLPKHWTTHDVARALNVSEHAVRTAVQWLADNHLIRVAGEIDRATSNTNKPYRAKVYEICPVPTAADIALLNRIFLLRT